MSNPTAQAFADFERFLKGLSAPALVGHSLAALQELAAEINR